MNVLLEKLKYCDKNIIVELGKLRMLKDIYESFFNLIIDKFIVYLLKMFKDKFYLDIEIVLIVGGFFECYLV